MHFFISNIFNFNKFAYTQRYSTTLYGFCDFALILFYFLATKKNLPDVVYIRSYFIIHLDNVLTY